MKTDPQNSDYVVESGATRNFEPWRAEDEVKIQVYVSFDVTFNIFTIPLINISLIRKQIVKGKKGMLRKWVMQ